jgi:CRISPR-associated protein Csd1
MALMKLCLIRKEVSVGETLNPDESNPAYICGELLAKFDQIQQAALGKVNATVIDKYYGGFSASPSTALGRLFANAQNHLTQKLKVVPQGQLTLNDQARFALGYYHAKAKRIEEWARRTREKAEADARKRSG